MRVVMGIALLLAGMTATELQAQYFGTLEPGQTVRVRTAGGDRFSTRLGGGFTDSLRFAHAGIPFQPGRVDSLWVRGHATKTGMIVGAAVAAPLSFGFFAFVCEVVSEGSGCDQYGTVALLGLAGGAAGALVGAGIGSLIPKWRLRYARQVDLVVRPSLGPGRIGLMVEF